MSMTEAGSLFREGKLDEAIAAANAAVRKAPTEVGPRILLAELLLLSGNADRCDTILDAASTIDPSVAVTVAEFRQLLRADMARRQLYTEGRVPELLGDPTPSQVAALAALVALREGNGAEAAAQAEAAEAARPPVACTIDGKGYADFRDADDLLGGSIEVLTVTGKYMWVPLERVAQMEMHPPTRPRDLAWRRVTMSVAAGPDGDVYVPVIYVADGEVSTACRLGRETDWRELEGGLVRGVGQRTFLAGDDALGIMEIARFESGGEG